MNTYNRILLSGSLIFCLSACNQGQSSKTSTEVNGSLVGFWRYDFDMDSVYASIDKNDEHPVARMGYSFFQITSDQQFLVESRGIATATSESWAETKELRRRKVANLIFQSNSYASFQSIEAGSSMNSQSREALRPSDCGFHLISENEMELQCTTAANVSSPIIKLVRQPEAEVVQIRERTDLIIRFLDEQRKSLQEILPEKNWKFSRQVNLVGNIDSTPTIVSDLPNFQNVQGHQIPNPKKLRFSRSLEEVRVNDGPPLKVKIYAQRDLSGVTISIPYLIEPEKSALILRGKLVKVNNGIHFVSGSHYNNFIVRSTLEYKE